MLVDWFVVMGMSYIFPVSADGPFPAADSEHCFSGYSALISFTD